jgi:hypothetical protein
MAKGFPLSGKRIAMVAAIALATIAVLNRTGLMRMVQGG